MQNYTSAYSSFERHKSLDWKKKFRGEVVSDFSQMTLLVIISAFIVYFTPLLIRSIFFLIPLLLFSRSKKDYFWFAYFFIIINYPAGFFFGGAKDDPFRLPLYGILSDMSFTVTDLFLFIALFKAIQQRVTKKLPYSSPLKILMIYFLLITIPISTILGVEIADFLNSLRALIYFSLIYSFYQLIKSKDEIYKFGYLVSPYVFLILFSQIYFIIVGDFFISNFNPSMANYIPINTITGEIRPIVAGILILFYSFIFGLQLTKNHKYNIFGFYPELIVIISIISVLLSATRSWIAMILGTLVYFYTFKRGTKLSKGYIYILSITVLILLSSPILNIDYFERNVWDRFYPTVSSLLTGSSDNLDTFNDRIINDIPKVFTGFKKSPLLGVGLSNLFKKHYSNDIGFLNTILLGGIIGFIFFLLFLFSFFKKMINESKFAKSEENKNLLTSYQAAWFGILIGYFTTWDFFSFYAYKVFFIAVIIGSVQVIIRENRYIIK